MKYAYPAIFTPEDEGGYGVMVPDLPGCFTCGNNIIDAIDMARDAISMWICDAEDKNESIPEPSDLSKHQPSSGGFINLVDVDTIEYRRQNDSRAVKKTLTIPSWLNVKAEKAGINFSQVLQNALKDQLDLNN
ncbi:type II toxin-antitoxin system HicB family antitoxin [Desulfosporosinus sp. SB140]|uniref:type II toxin-antitoxin system HicB family antitoxin n=1 Tax=Desulfosporosinus paludis TaxID=3115649 RepID=UPI00388F25F8